MFVVITSNRFDREFRKLLHKHIEVGDLQIEAAEILKTDPYNISREYRIKKLNDVSPRTDGQWRLTMGEYRIRYDIEEKTVILLRISDRKDAYRK